MMLRSIVFSTVISLMATPAFAAHCSQPFAPDTNLGAGANKDAVVQLRQDVQAFLTASDVYQQCLVGAAKADATFAGEAKRLADVNQADKQKLGDAFNAIVKAFNAHS
jgi:hypothetical protein